MDYKEVTKVFSWVFRNVKFTAGTDARVYATILAKSSYKDSLWSDGDYYLAEELEMTRQQVAKSIKRLVHAGLMTQLKAASGRRPAIYKLRTEDDMKLLAEKETINPEWKAWCEAHDQLFFTLEKAEEEIGSGCKDCLSTTNGEFKLCPRHQFDLERFREKTEYREKLLWERDHPQPESKCVTVEKIELI